ncbi:type VI secretion system baseplate subunit TssE [Pseudomonas sp. SCB32]|uniref:type VI secretion system baseplate subunit TssE n=1 Tax=Pseudomonas sp. SCB32 TaxID=2653853 RepID=UPI00126557C2|nr:type VI secretion system baseplate subunit TssE [Pseudomonas sp. SCB32]
MKSPRELGHAQQPRERLRPALLDRLTDEAPDQLREPAGQFLTSERLYRDAVLRDLRWLFNTSNVTTASEARRSAIDHHCVLGYGIRPLAGRRMSEIEWHSIEQEIHQVIVAFEPRIIPDSLEVRCIPAADTLAHYNLLALRIHGLLWSVPYPLEFLLRSEIDLESGQVNLLSEGA